MGRLSSEARRLSNAGLAAGTQAYKRGQLNDPQLTELLDGLEDYVELERMGGDYYYIAPAKNKTARMSGQVFLEAEPRMHGASQHPLTHKGLAATQLLHAGGGVPLVNAPAKDPAVARAAELIDKYVMPTSIRNIGSGGERSALPRTAEELQDVAASLLVDTDRGYNSRAGYAYGGLPLDAGHVIGYINRPDLANKGFNLENEIGYVNRGKAATEKMAGNQGREATDEELAAGLLKSHVNKLTEDVVLPGRKNSKERQAFMAPINAQVAVI